MVFSADGIQGVGILGDGRTKNGGESGEVAKHFFSYLSPNFPLVSTPPPFSPILPTQRLPSVGEGSGVGGHIATAMLSSSHCQGRLGFLTALHKAGGGAPPPVAQMLSWDSGGSSFQLSLGACGGADATTAMPRVFEGAWGSSKVVYALARTIQQKPPESPGTPLSVNPCTAADWATLVAAVAASLSPPDWLQAAVAAHRDRPVAAVGGPTSAFRVAALAVGRGECVTAAEVQQAAAGLCGCSDAEVGARGLPQPQMAVAKLGLVYAVMTACGIQCFTYFPTTGNTAGMLLSEKYWA